LFRCWWLKNINARHITIRLNKYSAPCKKIRGCEIIAPLLLVGIMARAGRLLLRR
jgi:hypothetical protein